MQPHLSEPGYLKLHRQGQLTERAQTLWNMMGRCELCPRRCHKNRLKGETGFCGAAKDLVIASHGPHFGEEKPLVGRGGSGTIFFSHCSLRCVFCINWDISHLGKGTVRGINDLAYMMMDLQQQGCHNINLVTPTHYVPHILLAVDKAAGYGLHLPLVYNTCGWERLEILEFLDGVIDVYLPDYKYASSAMSEKYSAGASSYPFVAQKALLQMYRQVGTARVEADGLVKKGLMIRHLVMPDHVGGTKDVIQWIASHLPKDTYFNLMSQYHPYHKAFDYPEIARTITPQEYRESIQWVKESGLTRVDFQRMPLGG